MILFEFVYNSAAYLIQMEAYSAIDVMRSAITSLRGFNFNATCDVGTYNCCS